MAKLTRKIVLGVNNFPVELIGLENRLQNRWPRHLTLVKAESRLAALNRVHDGDIDLVITTLTMKAPDDGERLVKSLREMEYEMPCIMFYDTEMEPDEAEAYAKEVGLQGIFNKSVKLDEVTDLIAKLLNLP